MDVQNEAASTGVTRLVEEKPPRGWRRVKTLYYGFTTLAATSFVLWHSQAAIAFVNSSFLSQFLTAEILSIMFMLEAVVIIGALILVPSIVRTVGVRTLLIILLPLFQASLLFMGLSQGPVAAIIFFIIQGVCSYSIFYILDLYIERVTRNEGETGNIRGIFLTSANIAIFFAPLAAALLVVNEYYPPLYAFAAFVLVIPFALALTSLRHITPVAPRNDSFKAALRSLATCRRSIAYTILIQIILQTFFAWMTIYAPLTLIEEGGYQWHVVGVILAVAMLPYLFLELPLGVIADRFLGETEIMTTGIVIMALSTALLAFIPLSAILLWGFIFFVTRIGAAMTEIATESYFFKQVNERDAALVSLFRITRPLGILLGPLIAIAFLPVTGLHAIFGVFGAIILAGVPLSMRIRDTK